MFGIDLFDQFKRYILLTLLAAFAAFAIINTYFSSIISIPNNWFVSAIFVALLFIVEDLRKINKVEDRLDDIINETGYAQTLVFPSYEEFYNSLNNSVEEADTSLYLTHIRNESPEEFDAESTRNYFNKLEKWCEEHPSGQIKRVTTLSNDRMLEWGKELSNRTEKTSNFYVKVCGWELDFPFINLAIVDEKEVYIALTADTAQETTGIRIQDKKVADSFVKYFNHMWIKSQRIDEKLDEMEVE